MSDDFELRSRVHRKKVVVRESVDEQTGEVKPGYEFERDVDTSRYTKIYDPARLVALGQCGYKVFMYCISKLSYGSQLRFCLKDAVEFTGLCKTSVYAGVGEMTDLGIIRKVRAGVYEINPNVAYRGKRERSPHSESSVSAGSAERNAIRSSR